MDIWLWLRVMGAAADTGNMPPSGSLSVHLCLFLWLVGAGMCGQSEIMHLCRVQLRQETTESAASGFS